MLCSQPGLIFFLGLYQGCSYIIWLFSSRGKQYCSCLLMWSESCPCKCKQNWHFFNGKKLKGLYRLHHVLFNYECWWQALVLQRSVACLCHRFISWVCMFENNICRKMAHTCYDFTHNESNLLCALYDYINTTGLL